MLICLLFVGMAWAYGLVLPAFENLDEIEHFSAIRYVADTGKLPIHDPDIQERYHYRQEASQPPLYYILMGGLTRLLRLDTSDTNRYLVFNPFVACGPSDNPYNKHILYHNPSLEAFSLGSLSAQPWNKTLLALHILRVVGPLLQVITVIGVYAIARLTLPRHPAVALLAAGLTAFNPQFLIVASGVNNDNLVTPLATTGLYLALLIREHGLSPGRALGLGLFAGLAGLSKLSGLLLLPFVGFVLLEQAWRSRGASHAPHSLDHSGSNGSNNLKHARGNAQIVKILSYGLVIGVVAAAVCGWWFWRNWRLYEDPTALEPMLKLVGRRASSILPLNESDLVFRSFWGQISCAFFSDQFYLFFGTVSAIGLVGILVGAAADWRRRTSDRKVWINLLWLILWFLMIFVAWLRWDLLTPAPGGRLLFPAIASTSIFLAYGWLRLIPQNWRTPGAVIGIVILAGAALATLQWELRPFFAPPRIFANEDELVIPYPLEAVFHADSPTDSTSISLMGYDARIQNNEPYLDVTLYWKTPTPISQDYALAIQLTSPIPGNDTLRLNYNTWPGRGNYPTQAWTPERVIADRYQLRLPASNAPTQAWQLLVALYNTDSGDRLAAHLDGQAVGKGLVLTTLRVPGRSADCPEQTNLREAVFFSEPAPGESNEVIALTTATVEQEPGPGGTEIQVSLCWEGLSVTSRDYTVFVHLLDEDGSLVATGDGPPMQGAFPTGLWQPGDKVHDVHVVPLNDVDLTKGQYQIGVGLYDLDSGERLPAVQAGQSLTNNTVMINTQP
jgi:hypothetical protein